MLVARDVLRLFQCCQSGNNKLILVLCGRSKCFNAVYFRAQFMFILIVDLNDANDDIFLIMSY